MNDTTTIEPATAADARAARAEKTADALLLKGTSYTITSVRLLTTELAAISTQLLAKVEQAPTFFKDAPVVIDLEEVPRRPLDLAGLLKVLRSHGMVPMGIRGGSEQTVSEARDIGLARLTGAPQRPPTAGPPAAEPQPAPAAVPAPPPAPPPAAPAPAAGPVAPPPAVAPGRPTRLVSTPVRGGQQLYAEGADLVLTAGVNQGAEVLADGHVHVYGPLRGRALAGAKGNRDARIFTTCLEAELLSVAGVYTVVDDNLPESLRGKPAQVYLDGEKLKIVPLA